jgi:hypothetical protein
MDNTAQQVAPAKRIRGFAYFMTPSGWAFLVLATAAISIVAFRERSVGLIFDQEAYIQYFRSTDWHWLVQFYQNRESDMGFLISLITEELGWRSWVILLNAFGVTPEGGIRTTVVLLNLIVMYSLLQTRRPLIGLLLWLVIPYALATVGLFQIRQGFGLAIAMLFACRFNRPTLGMGLASFVHTTFAVPTALLLAAGFGAHRGQRNGDRAGVGGEVPVRDLRRTPHRRIHRLSGELHDQAAGAAVLLHNGVDHGAVLDVAFA